jgi:bifunctional DNA-binding transcriptional regulator/antitoxin component of YhaV-PrlF toxin-antitoxin module
MFRQMSVTAIEENGQITLPAEVCKAAAIQLGDKVEWRFEDGEIRGRKLSAKRRVIVGKLVLRNGCLILDTAGLDY